MVLRKKKKPKFNTLNTNFRKSVKSRWRKPRGIDNKKRIRKRSAGGSPKVGYGTPMQIRALHPSGLKEKIVHNVKEVIETSKGYLIRVASSVGLKKKKEIIAKAQELNLEVINKGV
ncbi:50S ribosomal protein L32e [Candidatus Micrarchaeota archaeon]|nr:50S ribosomal protein L32e [Candidatus Micrarchaeota archaeon]